MPARAGNPNASTLRRLFAPVALALSVAPAEGGPENALVVVNADSWASTYIANEYVAARHIPACNVVYLRDLPDFERMGVEDFRVKILAPALHSAELRQLAPQIDCLLYSADFPTAIDVSADIAGKQLPKIITQPASINGLTYLYQLTLAKNPGFLGLNTNFYYRQLARPAANGPWNDEDQHRYAEALRALQTGRENGNAAPTPEQPPTSEGAAKPPDKDADLRAARTTLLALRASHPKNAELLYNVACVHARLGDGDAATEMLREAIENGWWDMRLAKEDPDLAILRERPDFAALVARAKLVKFELAPTSGFRASVGWLPNGQPVPPNQGIRYMLSTVLACTSGRGNSVREALNSLNRSIAADGSHPKGTIYFMENKDVRSTTREWGFGRAAEKLREIGVAASIEGGVLPLNKPDVAGATIGSAGFDWNSSGSAILPGAICEHLTSFGGAMEETSGQTPLTEFIRHGAAGASGTVTEPFAVQAKFPTPFIHYHYARGCTLAEAFYQSIAAPYQLLVVGDALCAPWGKRMKVTADAPMAGAVLRGALQVQPRATSEDGITAAGFELFVDGRRVTGDKAGRKLELDTTKVPDGPHEIVLTAIADDPITTRASLRVPVVIRNTSGQCRVTAPAGGWPWDKPLLLTADAPGAKSIAFFHNTREVARIPGASGSANLDPRILGQGHVRIQPIATLESGELWGEPIALNIEPPAPLPAAAQQRALANGFRVIPAGGAQVIVNESTNGWLAKAGVTDDGGFEIDGRFTVPAKDVYQFQIRGPATVRLRVDGKPQDWPRGEAWWFVPVHLAKGRHRLQIEGKADGAPKLDVRFGGPGSRRLDGARFQHLTVE